jgi:hypothetical protein
MWIRTIRPRWSDIGYGWVFARKPVIEDATYQSLLSRMKDQGYDIGQFRRAPQTADQIGYARLPIAA